MLPARMEEHPKLGSLALAPDATVPSSSTEKTNDALASLRIDRGDESQRRSGWWKWIVALVVMIVGIFGWSQIREGGAKELLGGQSEWVPEIMQNRVEVRLATVVVQKGRSADAVVVATGYLESRRQARIGARASGRIDVVNFEEGDRVKKGQLLAELEHRDLDASLSAATAAVRRAEAAIEEQTILVEQAFVDKNRNEELWSNRSVAKSLLDDARFAYRTAQARRESMQADLELVKAQEQQALQLRENMFIRAPFDGTVISKDAEVGESILPGGMGGGSGRGSVATIADLEHLEIECDVQEAFISRVNESQDAEIAVDAVQHKRYRGAVRKIIPMGDRARATIKVQVTITDADELLFPEMAGTVYFLPAGESEAASDDRPRLFCPASAIDNREEGLQYVWTVDAEKRAVRTSVKASEDRDGRCEIFEGLQGRERVIVNPEDLQQGTPVTVID